MEVSSFLASRMARQAGGPKLATDHMQGHRKFFFWSSLKQDLFQTVWLSLEPPAPPAAPTHNLSNHFSGL